MRLCGIASKEQRDAQDEYLVIDGMNLDSFVGSFCNWNHLGGKDPSTIIGQVTKAEKRKDELYVEIELFEEMQKAKDAYKLTELLEKRNSKRRMQLSIEGKALERDPFDKGKVTKSKLSGIAMTVSPINSASLVQIMKGETDGLEEPEYETTDANGGETKYIVDFIDEFGNRIMVDMDYNFTVEKAVTTTNAAALIPESLEGDIKNTQKRKKIKKSFFIDDENSNFTQYLEKSQVYDYFFKSIPNITSSNAKRLFQTIVAFNKSKGSKMPETEITNETLEKAFETLNILSKTNTEDLEKSSMEQSAVADGGQTSMINKMKSYVEKGFSKEEMFKAMKEEDESMSDEEMEKTYKSNFDKKSNKGDGKKEDMKKSENIDESIDEKIEKAQLALDELTKAKEAELQKSEEVITPVADNTEVKDLIKGYQNEIVSKFEAMGKILKSVVGENEILKAEEQVKEDALKKAKDEYERLANEAKAPKSITTESFIQKSQDQRVLGESSTLSITANKADILKKGDEYIDWNAIKAKNKLEKAYAESLGDFQMEGKVAQSIVDRFRQRGITLVA